MENIQITAGVVELVMVFVFCLAGAACKDYYNTLTGFDQCIRVPRIMIAALTGTVVMFGVSHFVNLEHRFYLMLCFISGVGGFGMFKRLDLIRVERLFTTKLGLEGEPTQEPTVVGQVPNQQPSVEPSPPPQVPAASQPTDTQPIMNDPT